MRLMVIGLGQCGNRVADEFARMGKRALGRRGIDIVTTAFAVDTDAAALSGLYTIRARRQQILLGEVKTRGHGVGKQRDLAAQIATEESFKIVDAIRQTERLSDTDAFLVITGAAGGTGSGSLPVVTQLIKERYVDRPVYILIVLPFDHEADIEKRNVENTAACLQAVYPVASAVFLVDNQRYVRKGVSIGANVAKINEQIVAPFYSMLSAGEERKRRRIGVSMLDAGDIQQTLSGWTAIGYGKSLLHLVTLPWDRPKLRHGIKAMDEAISELSVQCDIKDAGRVLYLLSAPEEEMAMDLVKHVGDYLRTLAPTATMRYGDYPYNKGLIDVTVIFSALAKVDKVSTYYARAASPAGEPAPAPQPQEGTTI